jgi:uncharacterized protein YeaO (DUF488 family)
LTVRIVRLGSPRSAGEGLRLGTVRRLPRGVRKEEYAERDYFDLWFPELAPSQKLLGYAVAQPLNGARWEKFSKSYRREMAHPGAQRVLQLLAQLSQQADFSVGCYCEDQNQCHRSLLGDLLREHGAKIT